jgi:polyA polymerase family protein
VKIDEKSRKLLYELENSGFKAYFVGGCVRDSLMGRDIHDIDIATDASPEQIIHIFDKCGCKTIPTGLKHGTVTVISENIPYEITTFRIDGEYTDSRRPDRVVFTSDIVADLSRRDFTVNAMAMDSKGNILDPYGGREDMENMLIRCVGKAEKRFGEDALRIMRAVRFASQLGFNIESETGKAVFKMKKDLHKVSFERLRDEFDKLLCGENAVKILLEYREIVAEIVPEIRPCFDFNQHSKYHKYNVYEHIVRAVGAAPRESVLIRRAAFFHDIGKPEMFVMDENGVGHFKGHAELSAEMAEKIMARLRYDNHTIYLTSVIISRHSDVIGSERSVKRLISRIGMDGFRLLVEMKKADNSAKRDFVLAENEELDHALEIACRLEAEGSCLKLSDLAVDGNDMLSLGYKGRKIGETLDILLECVIDGRLANEKNILMDFAEGLK